MVSTGLCSTPVIGPFGPVTSLGFGLIGSVNFIIRGEMFSIPLPAESVRSGADAQTSRE
jgi:hypothetical protein